MIFHAFQIQLDELNVLRSFYYIFNEYQMVLLHWLIQTLELPQTSQPIEPKIIATLISRILIKIDPSFFAELSNLFHYDKPDTTIYASILSRIQKYLIRHEWKKLNIDFIQSLVHRINWQQLIGLVLYLSVNSQLGDEVVQKIMQFEQCDQKCLMQIIRRVQGNCERLLELRQVLERVQAVEAANNKLQNTCQERQRWLEEQGGRLQELEEENRTLAADAKKYNEQKQIMLNQLKLYEMPDFIELCGHLKHQNSDTNEGTERINVENQHLQGKNQRLRQELQGYGRLICGQLQQLERLKERWTLARQQYVQNEGLMPLLPLTDNKNILNIESGSRGKQNLGTDRTSCSSRRGLKQQPNGFILDQLSTLIELEQELQQKRMLAQSLREKGAAEHERGRRYSSMLQQLKYVHQSYNSRFFNF